MATLAARWDGTQWQAVASPNPGFSFSRLEGVIARAANDVWAVGLANTPDDIYQSLTEHWNGTAWQVVPSPNPAGASFNRLVSAAAPAGGDVWAGGFFIAGDTNQAGFLNTLTLHYQAGCATATATAATPPLLTGTPTAPPPSPTRPPAASPTPCAIAFTDVRSSDYFYTPVRYLACHGVLSGYADHTLRPAANTTRAGRSARSSIWRSRPAVVVAARR